jgi:hypothetical protein
MVIRVPATHLAGETLKVATLKFSLPTPVSMAGNHTVPISTDVVSAEAVKGAATVDVTPAVTAVNIAVARDRRIPQRGSRSIALVCNDWVFMVTIEIDY